MKVRSSHFVIFRIKEKVLNWVVKSVKVVFLTSYINNINSSMSLTLFMKEGEDET